MVNSRTETPLYLKSLSEADQGERAVVWKIFSCGFRETQFYLLLINFSLTACQSNAFHKPGGGHRKENYSRKRSMNFLLEWIQKIKYSDICQIKFKFRGTVYNLIFLHNLVEAMIQIHHYDLFKTKQWLETPRKAFKRGHKKIKWSY